MEKKTVLASPLKNFSESDFFGSEFWSFIPTTEDALQLFRLILTSPFHVAFPPLGKPGDFVLTKKGHGLKKKGGK